MSIPIILMTVAANRTESLDASHNELSQGNIILPRNSETIQEFARQCANVARVLETDPDTGSSRYVYLKTGPDHFRHAFSYESMARQSQINPNAVELRNPFIREMKFFQFYLVFTLKASFRANLFNRLGKYLL